MLNHDLFDLLTHTNINLMEVCYRSIVHNNNTRNKRLTITNLKICLQNFQNKIINGLFKIYHIVCQKLGRKILMFSYKKYSYRHIV